MLIPFEELLRLLISLETSSKCSISSNLVLVVSVFSASLVIFGLKGAEVERRYRSFFSFAYVLVEMSLPSGRS